MLLDLVYKLTRIKKLHDIRIVILALPCNRTLVNRTVFYFCFSIRVSSVAILAWPCNRAYVNRTVFYFCFPLYYLYLYLYNINISHMTSKLIHFLIEKKFEVWRFAVTSFDIITGMEICFATITSSFTSVDCMSKRDTGNVFHGVRWLCMSKRGMHTDIDSIYHSVTDKLITGLQISFYLAYIGSRDSWKEE
jgi:hypothetical protein